MTSSKPNYVPKTPPSNPNTIHIWIRTSTHELWAGSGETNIQSITVIYSDEVCMRSVSLVSLRNWSVHACMLSCFSHVWLFATLWTWAHQALLSMGVSRQEYWSGLPCLPPGDLSNWRIESMSLTSPTLAGGFFNTSATWEAPEVGTLITQWISKDFRVKLSLESLWMKKLLQGFMGHITAKESYFEKYGAYNSHVGAMLYWRALTKKIACLGF